MKVVKSGHKVILFDLFSVPNPRFGMPGEPKSISKDFALEKLVDASNAKKKVSPVTRDATPEETEAFVKQNGDQGKVTISAFQEGEVEFTVDEAAILKELFDAQKSWKVDLAELVNEVKELFNTTPEKKEKK